jgi:hypothetical protein
MLVRARADWKGKSTRAVGDGAHALLLDKGTSS